MAIWPEVVLSLNKEVFLDHLTNPQSSSFALTREVLSPVACCSKCRSVFITETHCESCGLRFQLDRVQGPLGERSFFGIKESAVEKSKIFGFYCSWLEKRQKRELLSRYFYRFRALVELLCTSEDDFRQAETTKHYMLELRLLIEELTLLSGNEAKTLEDMLMQLKGPKSQTLSNLIQLTFQKSLEKKSSLAKRLFRIKLFGVLPLISLVRVMAPFALITACALGLYRYFILAA